MTIRKLTNQADKIIKGSLREFRPYTKQEELELNTIFDKIVRLKMGLTV